MTRSTCATGKLHSPKLLLKAACLPLSRIRCLARPLPRSGKPGGASGRRSLLSRKEVFWGKFGPEARHARSKPKMEGRHQKFRRFGLYNPKYGSSIAVNSSAEPSALDSPDRPSRCATFGMRGISGAANCARLCVTATRPLRPCSIFAGDHPNRNDYPQ
jgi:hypothetical protein